MLSDAHFLAMAYIVSDAGTCARLKVGAVLVKDRRVISTGYNGAPAGMPHCEHPPNRLVEVPCLIAVHAEVNAIAFAARHGVPTEGSTLYTTDSPCSACAQLVINAGITEVKFGRRYRDLGPTGLLERAGLTVTELGEPGVHLVSVTPGDRSGVHPGKHTDEAFDQGWSEYAASHRGRSTGVQ